MNKKKGIVTFEGLEIDRISDRVLRKIYGAAQNQLRREEIKQQYDPYESLENAYAKADYAQQEARRKAGYMWDEPGQNTVLRWSPRKHAISKIRGQRTQRKPRRLEPID